MIEADELTPQEEKPKKMVWGVAFNHDGTRLASASADGRVCLWNIETHKSECQDMEMDTAEVRSGVFSLDGRRLALVGVDRTVHLWEVPWEGQTGQRLRPPLTGNNAVTYSVAFNHNGTYLATASADNKVRLWETKVDVVDFRRFLKKNFLIQGVGTGLIKMSYLGNTGWRSKRASTACIAALPSAMPFW